MNEIIQLFKDALSGSEGNDFLNAGLVLGAITAVLMGLKQALIWLWNRVERQFTYSVYLDNSTDMFMGFSMWYLAKYPQKFKAVEAWAKTSNNTDEHILRIWQYNDFNTLWYKRRLLFIVKNKKYLEQAKDFENMAREEYMIYGMFAKKAINDMMAEALAYYDSDARRHKGIRVNHGGNWDGESSDQYITDHKKLDHIFCSEKDLIVKDINKFLSNQEVYKKKGIKLKRSYLLQGRPGTGKTSLVFGIADWLERPVYYVNPSAFPEDRAFEQFIHKVVKDSIILIEDIDIFFTVREGKKRPASKISFQCLLNVLDGANSPSQVLIFMTTNHPEKLDSALTRKGRVDYSATLDWPDKKQAELFMSDFYDTKVELHEYEPIMPMSAIQDICLRSESPSIAYLKVTGGEKVLNGKEVLHEV